MQSRRFFTRCKGKELKPGERPSSAVSLAANGQQKYKECHERHEYPVR